MVVLLLVAGTLYVSYLFSYLFLWTVAPQAWPAATGQLLPSISSPLVSGALLVASSILMVFAARVLNRTGRLWLFSASIALALIALVGSIVVEVLGQWNTGLRPADSSYAALTYLGAGLQAELVIALVVMGAFTLARFYAGLLDPIRRATFDNTALLWHYTVGQGLFGLLLVHGFPRLVS
jgi:cytochrome c oxidase subunit I+III